MDLPDDRCVDEEADKGVVRRDEIPDESLCARPSDDMTEKEGLESAMMWWRKVPGYILVSYHRPAQQHHKSSSGRRIAHFCATPKFKFSFAALKHANAFFHHPNRDRQCPFYNNSLAQRSHHKVAGIIPVPGAARRALRPLPSEKAILCATRTPSAYRSACRQDSFDPYAVSLQPLPSISLKPTRHTYFRRCFKTLFGFPGPSGKPQ